MEELAAAAAAAYLSKAVPTPASALAEAAPAQGIGESMPTMPSGIERIARPPSAGGATAAPELAGPGGGCAEAFTQIEPQGLAATYWGESPEVTSDLSILFRGARDNPGGEQEHFERVTHVKGVPAGGRFAVTARIRGISSGSWAVSAERIETPDETTGRFDIAVPQTATAWTTPAPLVHGPGVRLWTWPLLVGLGAVFAIVMQALLLTRMNENATAAVLISILGCLLGYVGAKLWYLVLHRQSLRKFVTAGACIQGFLVVSLAVLVLGGAAFGLGVGLLLDVTTPGLFLGIAIGRPGCFLTGCCSGRPTMSRWGMWASDRTLAVRRIPVQLIEAFAGLLIGLAALGLVLYGTEKPYDGAVFVVAAAIYTWVRQLLFPYRADPHTRRGRLLTSAACGIIIVATFLLGAL
ncbi:prolipoprotein diacylglyceryl transferase family protein [Rhodococcus qingshengii]|uniref:prolipoprotein diacylglyceryl transferase family protein n=2 Tax=Rhodococcus TaxID=1827 RepID=UPI0027DD6F7B|nr:prolipoprotein diacylglyceryl transferase family protein [Rhodococcus qingshengii]